MGIKRKRRRHGLLGNFRKMSSGNVLGPLFWWLTVGRMDYVFRGKLKKLTMVKSQVKFKEMSMGIF